jgi:hypothetical protein
MPNKNAKKQTKAAYVLSLPRTMSAKDVVAKGKVAGVTLSVAHVYAIRSDAKKRKAHGKHASVKVKKHSVTNRSHAVGSHAAEELLKAVASELGLSHAMAILKAEHDRVHRLLGG